MPVSEDVQRLNERASELYNNGDYGGAKRLWEEVLKHKPDDPQAAEGFRMASMLANQWSPIQEEGDQADEIAAQIGEIEELLGTGRVADAMAGAQRLMSEHSSEARVRELYTITQKAYEAEPFIREHLDEARRALDGAKTEEARECCRKVLALDEGNREARELLQEGARLDRNSTAAAARQDLEVPQPAGGRREYGFAFDGSWSDVNSGDPSPAPGQAGTQAASQPASAKRNPGAAASPAVPAGAPSGASSGAAGLTEISGTGSAPGAGTAAVDDDLLDLKTAVLDLDEMDSEIEQMHGEPVQAAATADAGATGAIPGVHRLPSEPGSLGIGETGQSSASLEAMDEAAAASEPLAPMAGVPDVHALPSEPASFGEAPPQGQPEESVEQLTPTELPTGSAIADLDIESDVMKPGGGPGEHEATAATDGLSGAMEALDGGLLDLDHAAEVGRSDPNVAELITKARTELEAGRVDNALVTASRALSVDPNSKEAEELVEQSREALDQQALRTENLLEEARRCMERRDSPAAEIVLNQVLEIIPQHVEAREMLDRVRDARSGSKSEALPDEADEPVLDLQLNATPEPLPTEEISTGVADSSAGEFELADAADAIAPEASEAAETELPATSPLRIRRRSGGARPVIIALLGAGVLAAAGWFAWNTFMGGSGASTSGGNDGAVAGAAGTANSNGAPGEESPPSAADIAAALALAGAGSNSDATTAEPDTPTESAQPAEPAKSGDELFREGRAAFLEGRTDNAVDSLRAALLADPVDEKIRNLLNRAIKRQDDEAEYAKKLQSAKGAYEEENFADALRVLYRLPASVGGDDIQTFQRNAWYNFGVQQLNSGDPASAVKWFDEALQVDPNDQEASNARKFAEASRKGGIDEAYYTFVKSLSYRDFDAR